MPNPGVEQSARHDAIRELLRDGPVPTQQGLVDALRALGIAATQSSVSRDLREIGAIKTPEGYALNAEDAGPEPQFTGIAELLREIRCAGPHLIVIRTAIGAAQRVALALDRSGWPEMVGNIGGDDTVFVATDSANGQKILISKLERVLGPVNTPPEMPVESQTRDTESP